jgi:UDP-N-acetylglucosamine--dolichyl-phosphate N-acetylglucosaminephosphotransferase
MRDIRPAETLTLLAISLACIAVLVDTWRNDGEPLYASLAISGLAFAFSYALILWTGDVFLKRGYKGRDMSKKNPVEM